MDISTMTIEDFKNIPHRNGTHDLTEVTSLIILPAENLHDSGYRCMDFIAVKYKEPICKISGFSDVLHLDGIGGYGEWNGSLPSQVSPKGWEIDCLPCGLIRIFSRRYLKVEDYAVSDFSVYAIDKPKE